MTRFNSDEQLLMGMLTACPIKVSALHGDSEKTMKRLMSDGYVEKSVDMYIASQAGRDKYAKSTVPTMDKTMKPKRL